MQDQFNWQPSGSRRKGMKIMKVDLNPTVDMYHGTFGKMTFRRMYGKQTVMKTPDMSKVKWSKAQTANRQRFAAAIAYARAALADPKVRAHYDKLGKKSKRQPFRVAVSDFYAGKNLLELARK
jgi:predicted double-glycine peptidase